MTRRSPRACGRSSIPTWREDRPPTLVGLRLLAGVVAGRPMEVRADRSADDGRAYFDGAAIVVPPDLGDASREQVLVQAAMLRAGAFDAAVVRGLVGRRRVAERYVALEAVRAARAEAHRLPSWFVAALTAGTGPMSGSPAESRSIATSRAPIASPPFPVGRLRPGAIVRAPVPVPDPARLADSGEPAERSDAGDSSDTARFDDNIIGRIMNALTRLPGGRAASDEGGVDGTVQAQRGEGGRAATVARRALEVPGRSGPRGPRAPGERLPEWDVDAGRYRADWVTVRAVAPEAPATSGLPRPARLATVGMQRRLAPVILARSSRGRSLDGDDLHPDGAPELARWLLAPQGSSPPAFTGQALDRPTVGAMVLLDASDSTHDVMGDGRTMFDHNAEVAGQLVSALDGLGVPVALRAFRSWGRTALDTVLVKGFTDPADERVERSLLGVQPYGFTRLGGAIRKGASDLDREINGGLARLLILVSDGRTYDDGYEGRYAIADARRAFEEVRERGTGCLCIGTSLGQAPSEAMEVLGGGTAVGIGSQEEIGRDIGGLFVKALADTRRRGDHRC